jgi:glyoxylase-like metal-dependent hydrolase (beta-lactamase superfamily II)
VTVDVEVLVAGEVAMPRAYVFPASGARGWRRVADVLAARGGSLRAPLLAYVVRHPQAGAVLIDTGLHPDAVDGLQRDYGRALGTVFRTLRPAASFDEQLRERGVEPAGVELVVMTHLHVDHTSGMRLLPRAEFVCSAPEWAAATGRRAVLGGYAGHHLPDRSRLRLVDLEADGEPHGPFARTLDLLGDGSIRLVFTPGHTPGHLSVLLRRRAGPLLVVGDAAYTLRSIELQAPPAFSADETLYRRSLAELAAYARDEPAATLVPTHDPDAWRQLSA